MVFLNYSTMQMVAKIVYYGPGLCGKTTNLKEIYRRTAAKSRGEMVSLETETDRTLFFDLLPMDVGVIGGFKTKFQLYTVPGQVFYNSTRKLVLRGVDGIVFVADSQVPMLEANQNSFENLQENLEQLGLDLSDIPMVFQYNKRDLPNVCTVDELNGTLNPDGIHPFVESAALQGEGVFETLKEISKLTLKKLRDKALGREPEPAQEQVSLKVRDDEEIQKIRDEIQSEDHVEGIAYEEHTAVQRRPSLDDLDRAAEEVRASGQLDDSVTLDEPDDSLILDSEAAMDSPDDSIDEELKNIALNDFDGDDDLGMDSINLDEFKDLGDDDDSLGDVSLDEKDTLTGQELSNMGIQDELTDMAADEPPPPPVDLDQTVQAPPIGFDNVDLSADDMETFETEEEDLGVALTQTDAAESASGSGQVMFDDVQIDDEEDGMSAPTVSMTAEEAMASIELDDAEHIEPSSVIEDDGDSLHLPPVPPPAHDAMDTEPVAFSANDFESVDETLEESDADAASILEAAEAALPEPVETETEAQVVEAAESGGGLSAEDEIENTVDMLAALAEENIRIKRAKAAKQAKPAKSSSVEDLLSGLVDDKKKTKLQKLSMQAPQKFDQASLECRLVDGDGNQVAAEEFDVKTVKIGTKKYQLKVSITIDIES